MCFRKLEFSLRVNIRLDWHSGWNFRTSCCQCKSFVLFSNIRSSILWRVSLLSRTASSNVDICNNILLGCRKDQLAIKTIMRSTTSPSISYLFERDALAPHNLFFLVCYTAGNGLTWKLWSRHKSLTLSINTVMVAIGPIFFIVTAALGWPYAFSTEANLELY